MSKIDAFFLNTLLVVGIGGVAVALAANLILYPFNIVSLTPQLIALGANIAALLLRRKYPTISVLILTGFVLTVFIFLGFKPPHSITTHITVILLCGFIHSVMLKDKLLISMQVVCAVCIVFTFRSAIGDLNARFTLTSTEALSGAIAYSGVFFVLTYTTYVIKSSYDRMQGHLRRVNKELHVKAYEIEAQNEELIQIQDNLSAVNKNLESIVSERTDRIQHQNEMLIRYSYTNAHQLRGPVARLIGLASIYNLEGCTDPDFIMQKMVLEAHAIDSVVKQINVELDSGPWEAAQ